MKASQWLKPEYIYQPWLIQKRLFPKPFHYSSQWVNYDLPWRMPLRVRQGEEHERILSCLGVIDLAVTETLWRLTEPGEVVLDIGANVGYMTALLVKRVGSYGKVWAFEAHPEIFEELTYNLSRWQMSGSQTEIKCIHAAVTNHPGKVKLSVPQLFSRNRGLAFVVPNLQQSSSFTTSTTDTLLEVNAVTLDQQFPHPFHIGVLKLDVEGHERAVLEGGYNMLSNHRVRDLIFEEHRPYPTDVTQYLEQLGYYLFRLHRGFWKPRLLEPESLIPRCTWQPTSFLATTQPDRAIARFQGWGWQSLSLHQ